MGDTEEFNTLAFEKKLMQLKDTQESIQGLSAWCLKQRSHHKKIVSSWLNVLKRVKIEQRLVLFYLANDVIQYSKRKNYEFVESWGLNLQKATPLVRDEKVRPKILRILKIWEERSVYDDEFLSDLTGLLSAGAVKKTDDDPLDFQPQQLVNKIKQCQVLEADTDLKLNQLHNCSLELSDTDALCASLKERCHKEDIDKELKEAVTCVERYTQALQREIVARESLLALLTSANQYYSTQRGEVKVVAYAYKNFGGRVRALKRKLDELVPALAGGGGGAGAPSPPARDADVPSPAPDEDIDLPRAAQHELSYDIDRTFSSSLAGACPLGLSSFLTGDNPLALFADASENGNKIEVINTRPNDKQEYNVLHDFLKNLTGDSNPATSDNNSVTSGTMSQKSQDALPGLDLLTPESTGNPVAPISFYGTMDQINDEPEEQPYHPETASPWNTNSWNVTMSTQVQCDSPQSPPVHLSRSSEPERRGVLPPPPPPPPLPPLAHIEDVDHRLLGLPPPAPAAAAPAPALAPHTQDVDHRNLISLTRQPPAPPGSMTCGLDQDYRVPTMVPPVGAEPSDIVESVDMELSEDEDQQGTYKAAEQRRGPPWRGRAPAGWRPPLAPPFRVRNGPRPPRWAPRPPRFW